MNNSTLVLLFINDNYFPIENRSENIIYENQALKIDFAA